MTAPAEPKVHAAGTAAKRLLSPKLNPTGYASAAMAVYAAVVMVVRVVQGRGVFDPQEAAAGAAVVLALWTRMRVTPVADPRDGNGAPLAPAVPVINATGGPVSSVAMISPDPPPPDVTGKPPGATL